MEPAVDGRWARAAAPRMERACGWLDGGRRIPRRAMARARRWMAGKMIGGCFRSH